MFRANAQGELICRDLDFITLPKNLFDDSDEIQKIDLFGNKITTIEGSCILKLPRLKILDLRANNLEVLTESISFFCNLIELRLDNNNLMSLPLQLFQIVSLKILTVTKNSLFAVPEIISKLRKLENLSLSFNLIKYLPESIGKLSRLQELFIQNNLFTSLPVSIFGLELEGFGLEWMDYLDPSTHFHQIQRKLKDFERKQIKFIEFIQLFEKSADTSDILFRSIFKGEAGVVAGLVEADVDVNSFDANGYSPLMVAVKSDKSTISRMLIEAGASFKYGAGNYGSILHIAVYKSEVWLVELVLAGGVDVDTIDAEGNTALHILMGIFCKQKHKSKRIGELIVARGPKVNVHNYENWAPIHLAARKGYSSALKWVSRMNSTFLKDKEKFDLNIRGGSLGWVPLHLASHSNDFSSVEILIDSGADVSLKNIEGKTAKSTCKGNLTIYKFLLRLERMQRKFTVEANKIENLPVEKRHVCETGQEMYVQYRDLWSLFGKGNFKMLAELLNNDKESIVAADALYLISTSRDRHDVEFLDEAKKRKSGLGINEGKEAAMLNSIVCGNKKINHDMIGPKSKKIQPSVLCSQVMVNEDEF
jgi:ankyrin repeat protein